MRLYTSHYKKQPGRRDAYLRLRIETNRFLCFTDRIKGMTNKVDFRKTKVMKTIRIYHLFYDDCSSMNPQNFSGSVTGRICFSIKFFPSEICYFPGTPYLCIALVPYPFYKGRMKRESGESPEQSRCCKFHQHSKQITHCHWEFPGKALVYGNVVRRPAMHI